MSKKGVLTVVSGFSGAGKGTLMKSLLAKYEYGLSISATTRKPREGEVHGREYFFLSKEEFESMIAKEQFIEWAQYVGNYYGTPRAYVEEQLQAGKNVILEIEIQGAINVRKMFPEALLIFVTPPSAKELKARLVGRGTETMEVIEQRMQRALEECPYMSQYDTIAINDNLDICVEEIHTLIERKHNEEDIALTAKDMDLIERMQTELKAL